MRYSSTSRRKAWVGLLSLAAFLALAVVPAANANLTPSATSAYGSTVPGAHGDYTVTLGFSGHSNFPGALTPTLPGTVDDLKRWIIDSPAGLVGNPNAVPYDSRCTSSQFVGAGTSPTPSTCPAAAKVGEAKITFASDATAGAITAGDTLAVRTGSIYLMQTSPEVPTTLGTVVNIPIGTETSTDCTTSAPAPVALYLRTTSLISPVTSGADGDYRLRTKSQEDSGRPVPMADVSGANVCLTGFVKSIEYKLFGTVGGVPFITNPTRCDSWDTYVYGKAHDSNSNVDSDPNATGSNEFVKSAASSVTPDCSTLPAFAPSASETFSTVKRDTAPVTTFNIVDPNVPGVSVPKTIVTTFPETLTINGAALPLLCTTAERDAHACPDSSKVGTVEVRTGLLNTTMTGNVWAVQNTTNTTPDLLVNFNDTRTGGLSFWLNSTSQLINSKVITTFDNLPQVGFNDFKLKIDAGTTGFLKIRQCPDSAARPADGPITYQMTSWAGQSATVTNTPTFAECVGINKLPKPKKCVHHSLNIRPTYAARKNMKKAELFIDGHRVSTNKKDPFEWEWNVDDLEAGKHTAKVRAFYKSGKKAYKKISWKRC